MKANKAFIKKTKLNYICIKFITVIFCAALITPLMSEANAIEPKNDLGVSVSDFRIYSANDAVIKGSCYLYNNNDNVLPELFFTTELYYNDNSNKSNMIHEKITNISLEKLEEKFVQFNHEMPSPIPAGNYSMILRIYSKTGEVLGFKKHFLGEFEGTQGFLQVDTDKNIFKNKGDKAFALTGPTYKEGEIPILKSSIKNTGDAQIKAKPLIVAYKRTIFFEKNPVYKKVEDVEYTFEPGKETDIELTLPVLDEPESYYFQIYFVDNSQKNLSGLIEARYVKAGAGAKIIHVSADYLSGRFILSPSVVGPADGTSISGAAVEISVYDEGKQVLFADKQTVDLDENLKAVRFEKELSLPDATITVVIKVKEEHRILASSEFSYQVKDIALQPKLLTDVKDTKYEQAVNALARVGIVTGYKDNTFLPEKEITRAEFMSLLVKLNSLTNVMQETQLASDFPDVTSSHWAKDIILKGVKTGLLKGYPDNTFKPDIAISYAEAITVCDNLILSKEERENLTVWPDDFIKTAKKLKLASESQFWTREVAKRGDIAILINNTYKILKDGINWMTQDS